MEIMAIVGGIGALVVAASCIVSGFWELFVKGNNFRGVCLIGIATAIVSPIIFRQ